MTLNRDAGQSAMSSAMGAKVTISGPEEGMYLASGRGTLPNSLITGAGGRIVVRLSAKKALVVLPFTGYLALKDHREIAAMGPVTLDVERFNKMTEALTRTTGSG